ncbi:hypothetical protein OPV22_026921 [Ensete ventricosum]|uniref:Transmembrane protein n=1 Tax=Ensete ventricosum TaxID=4639 RepID=A0AAV8PYL9_ENSVE|nr:hypothetical protein OPV22_026921 [Ensete ventricosum]
MPCGRLPQSLLPLRLIVFRKTVAVIRLHSLSTNSRTSLIEDLEVLLESAKAIFLLFGFVTSGLFFFLADCFGDFRVFLVRSLFRSSISFFVSPVSCFLVIRLSLFLRKVCFVENKLFMADGFLTGELVAFLGFFRPSIGRGNAEIGLRPRGKRAAPEGTDWAGASCRFCQGQNS